ncbi:proton-coupled folate transporter-like isoform X2 [Babylonia areolata]
MSASEADARPAAFPVEEYRDMPENSPICGDDDDDVDDADDDDPLLQVTAVPVAPRLKVLPEIPTFLYFVALVSQYPVQQFWLYDYFSHQFSWEKTNVTDDDVCTSNNSSNSTLTSNSSDVENTVQAMANQYAMYTNFISSFTAIFPTLFLGPLTDRFGRKFVFYISLLTLFASQLLSLMVFRFNLTPKLLLLSSFIFGLSGSYGLYLAAAFGMVADISSEGRQRTCRVAVLEAAIAVGVSVGTTTSGIWVKDMGYVWPTAFSLGLILIATFYFVFLIPESNTSRHCAPFSCKNFVKCFEFYVKDTPNGRRLKLIVCLMVFLVYVASASGDSNFYMLFLLHQPFCWRKMDITVFSGALILVKWMLVMLFVYLGKRRVSEPVFTLVGSLSATTSYVLRGLATSNVFIFVAAGASLLTDVVSPMCRTMMSKSVSETEQGALFAGIGVLQMVVSAVSGVVMSVTYNAGLGVFLGLPYLVLAALSSVSVLLTTCLIVHVARHHDQLQSDRDDERIIN